MQQENSRNTIIFFVCSAIILVAYMFWLQPQTDKGKAAKKGERPAAEATMPAPASRSFAGRAEARAASPRIQIRNGAVHGSLSLVGARIDDLYLDEYARDLGSAARVEMFRPQGLPHAYFAYTGWTGENVPGLPGSNTPWVLRSGSVLTPRTPVVLGHRTPEGLEFTRTISMDEKFVFTISDRVVNNSGRRIAIRPTGSVQRHGVPADLGKMMILHEGAIGVFDDKLRVLKYDGWRKDKDVPAENLQSTGGWMGITDKYWLAALIPGAGERIQGDYRTFEANGEKIFETRFTGAPRTLEPGGGSAVVTTRLFAGAKRSEILGAYQKDVTALGGRLAPGEAKFGVEKFDDAIDWGMFWFFTRPLFAVLEFFYGLVGNFGVAILALTVVAKIVFFPLANQAFASMAKIKKLQPKVEELKKKYGDDPQKMQMEMMQLYQREKINPLAGCFPILIQIPVFYALYKVLFVTIEMRHAPFFGWIHDLSARDPSTFWNLFGLIPWNPATTPLVGGFLDSTLHIGVWPLLYGLTMWLQTAMNPPSPDPTQQAIMKWFPVIFTVLLAQQPAGLVIYWAWSNVLTILQQYIIMRRHKTANPIDGLIARVQGKEYQVPG